ncbi:MAG: ABC transporter permease [Catenulisporales bacterium]|jgi:peptide/nickel transport system permease protein|nr:ABC transporter permease [Catenulisporales bacterium]
MTIQLIDDGHTPETVGGGPVASTAAGRARLVWRRFRRNKLAVAGLAGLVLLFLFAFFGPSLTHWKAGDNDFLNTQTGPGSDHFFGTDDAGHDMFAQTVSGMRKSLNIGLLVAALSTGAAGILGTAAAYFGGWWDKVIVWLTDLFLVVPSLLMLIILSPYFQGANWIVLIPMIALFNWMITSRVVRGMTLTVREREFVRAARYMGVPAWTIIRRHILPNISSILIVDYTLNVGAAIVTESFLSFLGFGIRTPDVSLGTVINDGSTFAGTDQWYLFAFPASFLVLIILCVNFIGDGLRDALDPNSTGVSAR